MEEILKSIEELNKKYKSVSPDLTDELRTLYKMVLSKKKKVEEVENEVTRLDKECLMLKEAHRQIHEDLTKVLSLVR
jgi:uncharacterized coiled-coil DUF342 family protein